MLLFFLPFLACLPESFQSIVISQSYVNNPIGSSPFVLFIRSTCLQCFCACGDNNLKNGSDNNNGIPYSLVDDSRNSVKFTWGERYEASILRLLPIAPKIK